MIQLKATCLRCGGIGFIPENTAHSLHCPDCDGMGTILLTSQKWDLSLKRVPPFSLEEMEGKAQKRYE